MPRLALAAVSLAFLAACQPATTELTEEQKAEIAAEVASVMDEFLDAWREADYDRALSFFSNDPEPTIAINTKLIHGYATIDTSARSAFAKIVSSETAITDSLTIVLAARFPLSWDRSYMSPICYEEGTDPVVTVTAGGDGGESFTLNAVWVLRDKGGRKVQYVHMCLLPNDST